MSEAKVIRLWVEATKVYALQRAIKAMGYHASISNVETHPEMESSKTHGALVLGVEPQHVRLLTAEMPEEAFWLASERSTGIAKPWHA